MSELQGVPRIVGLATNDKLIHFGLYAILGLLLGWAKRTNPTPIPHGLTLSCGLIYGAVDELHQRFTPFRMPSWGDWLADVVGVVTGYVVFLAAWALVSRAGLRLSERTR